MSAVQMAIAISEVARADTHPAVGWLIRVKFAGFLPRILQGVITDGVVGRLLAERGGGGV